MTLHVIPAERLRSFGSGVFQKAGVPPEDAATVAEILVEANLRGVDTHGIYLSNVYVRRLQKGLINPSPKFHFEKRRAGMGILDADFSLGQLSTLEAARKAVELARDAGVGVVSVKNSNHFGAAAYYGEYCAKQDCIGLVMSDGECDVIPFGGREKFLGTNPICCCIPAGAYPGFCMDMATSEVAFGKVRAAAEAGKTKAGYRCGQSVCGCPHEWSEGVCRRLNDRDPLESSDRDALRCPYRPEI